MADARPIVSASAKLANVSDTCKMVECIWKTERSDCNVNHSLINPFNGGNPMIAIVPIRNINPVHGIFLIRPPRSSIFFVCVL